jgi:hypothetical protein
MDPTLHLLVCQVGYVKPDVIRPKLSDEHVADGVDEAGQDTPVTLYQLWRKPKSLAVK